MKVLKINRKLKNEKQKEYKKELKQINKTIMDIFPIIDIVEDKSIFKTTYGYMNILQIESKDIYSLNIDEVKAMELLNKNEDLQKELFEEIYKETGISMKAIIKTLINYGYFTGAEDKFDCLIDDMKKKLEKNELTANNFNILSTKEMLEI